MFRVVLTEHKGLNMFFKQILCVKWKLLLDKLWRLKYPLYHKYFKLLQFEREKKGLLCTVRYSFSGLGKGGGGSYGSKVAGYFIFLILICLIQYGTWYVKPNESDGCQKKSIENYFKQWKISQLVTIQLFILV